MGRRQGTVDQRVTIAVSPQMQRLREIQGQLNFFRNSTDLAYGLILSGNDARLADPDAFVSHAFRDVYSSAWYPSNQGSVKYRARVSSFLEQVRKDMTFVSRAVIVMWYSFFEEYLESRYRPICTDKRPWGPYTRSLTADHLMKAPTPVRINTLLRADLCREIRNKIVHGAFRLPDAVHHEDVSRWKRARTTDLRATMSETAASAVVSEAAEYVVGQAVNHQRVAVAEGKAENLEHFYMLFAFTNLDALAVEIEEALIPLIGPLPDGRLSRKQAHCRRTDLLVREIEGAT